MRSKDIKTFQNRKDFSFFCTYYLRDFFVSSDDNANKNLSEDIKNTKTLLEQQKDGQLNKEKETINQIINENERKINIMKKSIEEKDNNIMNMKLTLEEKENAIEIMKKTLQEKESNLI